MPLLSNFGGILQNYALQTFLKEIGHEPITIDLDPSPSKLRYFLRVCKGFLKGSFKLPDTYNRNPIIESFLRDNINLTKRIHVFSSLGDIVKQGDAFVVGSDQIWRYAFSKPYIYDVYLEFTKSLKCKRISYAASFGISTWDYPPKVTAKCKKLLSSFDAISVRENSAIELCKTYFGLEPKLVLDPTLLLDKKVYSSLCDSISKSPKTLVAYVLDKNENKCRLIEDVANKLNLEPVVLTEKRDKGITVNKWLSYFRDASFVITDSYHGTVFSIIFEKNFLSIMNSNRGADRFYSLLAPLCLQSRLISDYNDKYEIEEIDWEQVNKVKNEIIKDSKQYLINNLK